MAPTTRERIVDESLRLFAERGYAATSVAEIEAASGLSPGAGGLYRHFKSKYEVLAAAIGEHVQRTRQQVTESLSDSARAARDTPLDVRLTQLCKAGLAKVREERDIARVFFRDLDQFPELLAETREGLLQPMYDGMVTWFKAQPEFEDSRVDFPATCAVLGGAIVHYWMFRDSLAEPPGGADRDRFIAAWVRLALGLIEPSIPPDGISGVAGVADGSRAAPAPKA